MRYLKAEAEKAGSGSVVTAITSVATTAPPAWLQPVGRAHPLTITRREYRLFLLAIGLVAVVIVDDNFVHPAPGTSAGDHLLSALVPLAVLGALALVYPHLRAGVRAATSMTLGAIVCAVGFPGVYYIADGSAAFDHYTALLAFPAAADPARVGPGDPVAHPPGGREPATSLCAPGAERRDRRRRSARWSSC